MAQLSQPFNPNAVEADERSFDPMPAGTYTFEVVESTIKPTKAGTGQYIELTLRVAEGQFENRRLWERINFMNENAKVQTIGQQQLKALCDACGIQGELEDTQQLHGILFNGKVAIEQDKTGQYGPRNTIRAFSPYGATQAPAAPSPAPRAAAPAAGARPWQRSA
jgi:hypothetical protein